MSDELLWTDGRSLRAVRLASARVDGGYGVYRKLGDEPWTLITAPMDHKHAETWFEWTIAPEPISAELSAWLDTEVAGLDAATAPRERVV